MAIRSPESPSLLSFLKSAVPYTLKGDYVFVYQNRFIICQFWTLEEAR